MDNNQRLKAIQIGLKLQDADIARACKRGGYPVARAYIKNWTRGTGKTFTEAGKAPATPAGRTEYNPMPDEAFDAFCFGLRWIYEEETVDTPTMAG